jgi:hypothetical protein
VLWCTESVLVEFLRTRESKHFIATPDLGHSHVYRLYDFCTFGCTHACTCVPQTDRTMFPQAQLHFKANKLACRYQQISTSRDSQIIIATIVDETYLRFSQYVIIVFILCISCFGL